MELELELRGEELRGVELILFYFMKNLVLIFVLLYSYSTVCLSDDNAPSMMEMLQGYAVDMPMEEQKDLESPYTNWSSNFSNIAIFFFNQ